jgi:pimeloyl-ACP methyl ester carboxylesterase
VELPRALSEASALIPARRMLKKLPPGDGHAVMTLPGFLASGRSMRTMRGYLREWNYDARSWKCGRNLGLPRERDIELLLDDRLHKLCRKSGRTVSLIGWSLGGLFARELARRNPDMVRSVIMLGSPIGSPKATNAWRLFEALSELDIDDDAILQRVEGLREPVEGVPMTAVYSVTDAVVSSDIARLPPGENVENIGVPASHLGMGFNPAILYLIADRLRQPEGQWRPFEISGLRNLFFH